MKTYFLSALALAAAMSFAAGGASAQVVDSTKKIPPAPTAVNTSVTPQSNAKVAGAISDSAIIAMLQVAHTQQIAAAELAVTRAQSPRVKAFAEELKADHSKALQELQAYAERLRGGMSSGVARDSGRVGRDNNAALGRRDSVASTPDSVVVPDTSTSGRDANAAVGRRDSAMITRPDSTVTPPKTNVPDVTFENLPALSGHEFDHGFIRLQIQHHDTEINHLRNDVIPMIKDSGLKNLVQKELPVLGKHLRDARDIEAHLKTTN